MPMHDWTRVPRGVFHSFHNIWISDLQKAFNTGLLPPDHYALGEQASGDAEPKPITTSDVAETSQFYLARQRRIVIRHVLGDHVIAMLEIVSPANKEAWRRLEDFVDRVAVALRDGIHVLVIDPLPPSLYDPDGIHGEVWRRLIDDKVDVPNDKPLTLVSYAAGSSFSAYVEPISVGERMNDMPLFLMPERYVPVPLEETYNRAWTGVPQRWRRVLEGGAS